MHSSTGAPSRAQIHTAARSRGEADTVAAGTAAREGEQTRLARRAALAALLVALGAAVGQASPALAHDELVDYAVEVDVSTGAARALTLSFSDEVMDVGSEILVTGPDGADATDGAPEVSGRDVVQGLAAPLAEGDYDIAWRVVSSDGHPIQGALILTIAAGGDAAIGPDTRFSEGDSGETEAEHDHSDGAGDSGEAAHEHDSATEAAGSPVATIVSVAIVAVAAAGAVAAVIIGGRRRRQAFEAAGAEAADTEQGAAEQGAAEQGAAEQGGDEPPAGEPRSDGDDREAGR